jgi:hypothetical protein
MAELSNTQHAAIAELLPDSSKTWVKRTSVFLLEQVGGNAMAHGVRRHLLLDLGHAGGGMNGASEPLCRHRQHRITTGE